MKVRRSDRTCGKQTPEEKKTPSEEGKKAQLFSSLGFRNVVSSETHEWQSESHIQRQCSHKLLHKRCYATAQPVCCTGRNWTSMQSHQLSLPHAQLASSHRRFASSPPLTPQPPAPNTLPSCCSCRKSPLGARMISFSAVASVASIWIPPSRHLLRTVVFFVHCIFPGGKMGCTELQPAAFV